MSFLIDFVRNLIATNPARVYAYGGSILLAGALWLARLANVELSPEITTGIEALGVLIATELIRRTVFAPATVEKIVNAQAPEANLAPDLPPAV